MPAFMVHVRCNADNQILTFESSKIEFESASLRRIKE